MRSASQIDSHVTSVLQCAAVWSIVSSINKHVMTRPTRPELIITLKAGQ